MDNQSIVTLNAELSKTLTLIFLLMIILEAIVLIYAKSKEYKFNDTLGSFGVAIGNIIFKPITKGVLLAIFTFIQNFAIMRLPIDNVFVWIAAFFIVEFAYYWQHRAFHQIRYLWISHLVHHSSNTFTLPSAIRLSWFSLASLSWVVYLPIVIMGFEPIMIAILMSVNLAYQFLLHTEIFGQWKVLGLVFNSPAHHKIHHASNKEYIDKNFGGMLIIYDRIFGTFAQEITEIKPIFGLTKPIISNNPFRIVLSGWFEFFSDCLKSKTANDLILNIVGRPK